MIRAAVIGQDDVLVYLNRDIRTPHGNIIVLLNHPAQPTGFSIQGPTALMPLVPSLLHEVIEELTVCEPRTDAQKMVPLLKAAFHALRSYEFGNGSPDLAKQIADDIEALKL